MAPGKLDILVIPGPDPRNTPSKEAQRFVRGHNDVKTTIFAICTGVLVSWPLWDIEGQARHRAPSNDCQSAKEIPGGQMG